MYTLETYLTVIAAPQALQDSTVDSGPLGQKSYHLDTIRESILSTMLTPNQEKITRSLTKIRHPKPSWTPLWTP